MAGEPTCLILRDPAGRDSLTAFSARVYTLLPTSPDSKCAATALDADEGRSVRTSRCHPTDTASHRPATSGELQRAKQCGRTLEDPNPGLND